MVNLTFLHIWAWEGVRVGGAVAGIVAAYPVGWRAKRAVIRKWARP